MSRRRIDQLISSTLPFLHDVAAKCEEILPHDSLPPSFYNTLEWAALVREILRSIEDQLKANSLDPNDSTILEALESTDEAVKDLSVMFRTVSEASEFERGARYEDFLRKPNSSAIETVLLQLLQGPHQLVKKSTIKATPDQYHQLEKAINDLGSLQSSLPTDKTAQMIHNGEGDIFSNASNGRQNINKGSGTQYNSDRMTWDSKPPP
ncbi:hypothetical protein CEP53_003046 [Fusarium sp. AF-6]|nr:hypothetical protein CEP53_003046 [Fusarium sp. AF-6]